MNDALDGRRVQPAPGTSADERWVVAWRMLPLTAFLLIAGCTLLPIGHHVDAKELWQSEEMRVSPVMTPAFGEDGTLYASSRDGLHALSVGGAELWVFEMNEYLGWGHDPPGGPVLGPDGDVYVTCEGHVFRVDSTGEEQWAFDLGTWRDFTTVPVVDADGTVYVGSTSRLVAVAGDGTELWTYDAGADLVSVPLARSFGVLVGTEAGQLWAISSDGTLLWQIDVGGLPTLGLQSGAVSGPVWLSVAGTDGGDASVLAISDQGTIERRIHLSGPEVSASAVAGDGRVYVIDDTRTLRAFDPTGMELFRRTTGGASVFAPVVGREETISVATYNRITTYDPSGTRLGVIESDGALACRPVLSSDGLVAAVTETHLSLSNVVIEVFRNPTGIASYGLGFLYRQGPDLGEAR